MYTIRVYPQKLDFFWILKGIPFKSGKKSKSKGIPFKSGKNISEGKWGLEVGLGATNLYKNAININEYATYSKSYKFVYPVGIKWSPIYLLYCPG